MDKADAKIAEIRERALESERRELLARAEKMWPGDKKRAEQWVYKKLAAKYGFKRNENQEEIIKIGDLPLENMSISFCIGDVAGFGCGENLADILKRNVGETNR